MKRIVALIMALVMGLSCLMFVGCDNSGNGGNIGGDLSNDATYNGEAVEITFYHTMGATLRDLKIVKGCFCDGILL